MGISIDSIWNKAQRLSALRQTSRELFNMRRYDDCRAIFAEITDKMYMPDAIRVHTATYLADAPQSAFPFNLKKMSKAGALFEVLKEFAQRGINMTRIESRPARTELGAYIFFFDLEYSDSPQLEEALSAVEKKSIWLRNLGTFPVLHVK